MSYEKMDLEKFTAKLNDDGYPTIAGARRAVGKSSWSSKDKDNGYALVNVHFGEGGQKAAKPAKRGRPATKAAAAPVKAKPAKRTASVKPPREVFAPEIITNEALPKRTPVVSFGTQEPVSTSHLAAAASVIQALKSATPITPAEQATLDAALREYRAWESDQSKALLGRTPVLESAAKPLTAKPKSTVVPVARPHIAVPTTASPPGAAQSAPTDVTNSEDNNGIYEATLSPEQVEQLERIRRAAKAMPSLGPQLPPVPTS